MMNTEEIECPVCGEMVNINILEYKLYGGVLIWTLCHQKCKEVPYAKL